MEKLTPQIQAAISILEDALSEAEKCDRGAVGQPGVRLRALTSDVTRRMREVRMQVLDLREEKKAKAAK